MSKLHNVRTEVNGFRFASKREANRYQELLLLERAGEISDLKLQRPFELAEGVKIDGERRARPPLRYYADFVYFDRRLNRMVIEDSKGLSTPAYRMKKHLMATVLGIHVVEV